MNDLQLYKKIASEVFSRYNGDKDSFELFTLRTFIGNINNERVKNKKDAREEFKIVKKNVKSEALKEIVKDLEQAIFGDDDNDEDLLEAEELDEDLLEAEELDRRFKNVVSKKRRESLREYLKESEDNNPQDRVNALKISDFVDEVLKKVSKEIVNDDNGNDDNGNGDNGNDDNDDNGNDDNGNDDNGNDDAKKISSKVKGKYY